MAKTWNKPIHLLFIDGSHIYEDVLADFDNFYPHVVPGGVIAMYNVSGGHYGVTKAELECLALWVGMKSSICRRQIRYATLRHGSQKD